MTKVVRILLALLLLSGCGYERPTEPHPHLFIDGALNEGAVTAAISEWILATDGGFHPQSLTWDYPGEVANIRLGPTPEGMTGYHLRRGSGYQRIAVRPDFADKPDLQRMILIHELGHWLGGDHTPGGTMDPHVEADCVDQDALDQACAHIECGPSAAPTCY